GTVIDTLDRLGLSENTLVIYTADHGDAIGSHGGVFDKGSLMVEETMRVPLAIRWPGVIEEGSVSEALVTNMDLVPTVLDAAGASIPEGLDGESLVNLVRDPFDTPWREDLMCEHHGHGVKLFQRHLRWQEYKYVAHQNDIEEL